MRFGFPGDNLHLENHGVSEESFWPSFTDIMMVIVMVFLLVTVTVLLNNWTLITDLKQSVKEQKVAASLAKEKQQENKNLASNLTQLKQQFVTVKQDKKSKEQKLSQALAMLASTQTEFAALKQNFQQIEAEKKQQNEAINLLQANVTEKEKSLAAAKELSDKLISNLSLVTAKNDEQALDVERLRGTLAKWMAEGKTLTESLDEKATLLAQSQEEQTQLTDKLIERTNESKAQLLKLSSLEKVATDLQLKLKSLVDNKGAESNELTALKKEHDELMLDLETTLKEKEKQSAYVTTLKKSKAELKKILITLQTERSGLSEKVLQLENQLSSIDKKSKNNKQAKSSNDEKLKKMLATIKTQTSRIEGLENENRRLSGDIAEKLTLTEQQLEDVKVQLEAKDTAITVLQKDHKERETQLLSLQGEYDTLDTKYQKLLLPARSSKGKYVVSVLYKKSGRKRIIRLKANPNGSYKTVSKAKLHKVLTKLKKQHKTDLYIKVIIPNNSGLLHNEAWKFTSGLQRRYDYYSQSDSSN
jgi:chromosome segregation ATPase